MATIDDYVSGRVCEHLKLAFSIMDASKGSLKDTPQGNIMLKTVQKLAPKKLTGDQAADLIRQAEVCAKGERVCRALHKDTPLTESIFLNDLAKGMVAAGKAGFLTRKEAVDHIRGYGKTPIIVSRVSGEYAEICPTWAKRCLYWNMEKHQLKCIQRK